MTLRCHINPLLDAMGVDSDVHYRTFTIAPDTALLQFMNLRSSLIFYEPGGQHSKGFPYTQTGDPSGQNPPERLSIRLRTNE
jgi:hypothetical protein